MLPFAAAFAPLGEKKGKGCENMLFFFNFGNYFVFYGFNWRWRRFDWGWAVPAEEVGLKKKQLDGGWGGGRSASPADAFAEHAR